MRRSSTQESIQGLNFRLVIKSSAFLRKPQIFGAICLKILTLLKGQLISKCLFGVLTFFQKTNENKSTSSKTEFVRSFFGRNVGLKKIISNLSDLYLPAKGLEISEVTCVVHNSSKKKPNEIFFP